MNAESHRPLQLTAGLGLAFCVLSLTVVTPLTIRLFVGLGWLVTFAIWAVFFDRERRAVLLARSSLELSLRRRDEILGAIETHVPAIVYRRIAVGGSYEYQFVGGRTAEILGLSPKEAFGPSGLAPELFRAGERERIIASYEEKVAGGGGAWSREYSIVTPAGEVKWLRSAVQIDVEGASETSSTGVLLDVTEEQLARERTQRAIDRDALTGLYSHDFFERAVATAARRYTAERRSFAVVKFQVDDFQELNDALGIEAGNGLLCLIAEAALAASRRTDVVARLATERFAVLAEVADTGGAAELALGLVNSLGRRYSIGTHEIDVTISAGCAVPLGPEPMATDLMHDAGSALERSRADGCGMSRLYADEMTLESSKRVTIKEALREALARHEFTLAYQPKIDLASGRLAGCEALLRWRDPAFGIRNPADFIPIAERTGLIVPIGDWVFREACRQYVAWQAAGVACVPISVNVSAVQFARTDVHEALAGALAATGAPLGAIDIEITESLLVDCSDALIEELEKIQQLGAEISLDDFGTGFSSISYLKRLPLSLLKIDQSFASRALSSSTDAAIVRSIVYLADELGLRVIAEGAETAEQVQYLRDAGCQEIQGYFFSRPLGPDEFARYLTTHGAAPPRAPNGKAHLPGAKLYAGS